MNRNELNAIKEIANVRIEEILESLGIEYRCKYTHLTSSCNIHGGDRKDAWSFLIEDGTWKCFSRGCHETYGSDVFGLVRGIFNCSFIEAVKYVKKFVDVNLSKEEIQRLKEQKQNREFIKTTLKREEQEPTYDKSCLSRLSYHPYLEYRGYSREIIDKYHIGACLQPNRYMSNRIVIPILNLNNEIVGFTGRTLDEHWASKGIPKWKHSKGSWVSKNLFNINNAASYITETGLVIFCEGPLDVLRLEEAGIHNSVAIMGKTLYASQLSILIEIGAFSILDALDNDKAGRVGSNTVKKVAGSFLFDIRKLQIPDGFKDIGEMSVEEVRDEYKEMVCAVS